MLSLAVLGLVGGWVPEAAAQKRGGKLVYAVGNDPYSPAPYVFGGLAGTAVNGAQYNSLLRISTEGKVVPELAERYEMVDDTTYVFTLHQGVTFHDGDTLNADDVVFSLHFYMGKESGGDRPGRFSSLAGRGGFREESETANGEGLVGVQRHHSQSQAQTL